MISKFKTLPKGIQRAIIVASFIIPFIIIVVLRITVMDMFKTTIFHLGDTTYFIGAHGFFTDWIVFTIVYWMLTLAGIWIYEGFKSEK